MCKTNDRFDKLTNLDISNYYQSTDFWLFKSSFLAAFSYCVVSQSPYDTPDITESLKAFNNYLSEIFGEEELLKFQYSDIDAIISSDIFESIPEIEILNHPKIESGLLFNSCSRYHTMKTDYDFIDLGALARNTMYMVMREYITQ